ncbi:MAG: hypothetical protein E7411_02835 [Ruminococcaceae bacterium]|nr:hypothetical protein [Oscillospiraceae bacterium]
MSNDFLDTLYLFKCGIRGIESPKDKDYNIKRIYTISKSQGIWDTVFLSVIKLFESKQLDIETEIYNKLKMEFMVKCTGNSRRLIFVHNIIKKLELNGISCCILKGEAVSRYYSTPLARISSDVDILIDTSKTDECLEILKNEGFEIEGEYFGSHQIRCFHKIGGLIEVHIGMYGVKTDDIIFNREVSYNERYVTFEAFDKMKLKTLGYTDNAMFLILHFLKHFIAEGAGIRQLADTMLYIENNYEKIDFNRVNSHLENLGFKKIFAYMVNIAKEYLGFEIKLSSDFESTPDLTEQILNDMEKGGVFGKGEERRGFYDLYVNERYKRFNKGSIENYNNFKKLSRLFPDRKFMSVNYPYVLKSPLLLPVAWLQRIIDGFKKKEVKEVDENHIKRLEFLKELDMI